MMRSLMRSAPALLVGLLLGFLIASCGEPPKKCGPGTCNGCCDANGQCLAGTAVFDCGIGGAQCLACQPNELCRAGTCELFDGGEYDANFPGPNDASINYDAGIFDGGPEIDAGRDAGPPDAGRDAGSMDAGAMDAGRPDGGTDGGRPDGGSDAGMTIDAGPPVSFMTDLVPVFSGNCVSCHANRSTYSDVRARVVPFNPPSSLIFQKITGTQSTGNPMPPGGQLSAADPAATSLIERWILQGALNN